MLSDFKKKRFPIHTRQRGGGEIFFTSFSLVSAGKRSIKPQTVYMDSVSHVKRKSANPLPMQTKALAANVQQNAHSTSVTQGGQTSTAIISNPSQKTNLSDEKISNSLRSVEIDKQYLDAVNCGDMEAAGKMVDEAAKKADGLAKENTPAEAADTIFMTLQTN